MMQYLTAAAALLVAAWPDLKFLPRVLPAPKSPDYQQAVASLASVRLRLRSTDCLGDEQRSAINVLTLALVDGSDK
ncbi:MAG: hypothetical protein EBR82_29120 [Caulobacteraceae bacterium]|jgi:hypothetical protein|nr:hypothetical protein [Caulobacteraceae bacterium]